MWGGILGIERVQRREGAWQQCSRCRIGYVQWYDDEGMWGTEKRWWAEMWQRLRALTYIVALKGSDFDGESGRQDAMGIVR